MLRRFSTKNPWFCVFAFINVLYFGLGALFEFLRNTFQVGLGHQLLLWISEGWWIVALIDIGLFVGWKLFSDRKTTNE
jgi:hypothetical protein